MQSNGRLWIDKNCWCLLFLLSLSQRVVDRLYIFSLTITNWVANFRGFFGWLARARHSLFGRLGWLETGPLFREKAAGNCFFLSERQSWLEAGPLFFWRLQIVFSYRNGRAGWKLAEELIGNVVVLQELLVKGSIAIHQHILRSIVCEAKERIIGTQLEKVRCLKCSFFQDLGCETKDLSTAPVLWQNWCVEPISFQSTPYVLIWDKKYC